MVPLWMIWWMNHLNENDWTNVTANGHMRSISWIGVHWTNELDVFSTELCISETNWHVNLNFYFTGDNMNQYITQCTSLRLTSNWTTNWTTYGSTKYCLNDGRIWNYWIRTYYSNADWFHVPVLKRKLTKILQTTTSTSQSVQIAASVPPR